MKSSFEKLQATISVLQELGEPFRMSAQQILVLTCTFVLAFNLAHAFYR